MGGSVKVSCGGNSSKGGSEGRGGVLVVEDAIVSLLNVSVVTSVTSEVGVVVKVPSNEVHDSLTDGQRLSEDTPSDTFPARGSSERSFVGKEFSSV